jgi:hypothetical protein
MDYQFSGGTVMLPPTTVILFDMTSPGAAGTDVLSMDLIYTHKAMCHAFYVYKNEIYFITIEHE